MGMFECECVGFSMQSGNRLALLPSTEWYENFIINSLRMETHNVVADNLYSFATTECRWMKRLTFVISLMKQSQNKCRLFSAWHRHWNWHNHRHVHTYSFARSSMRPNKSEQTATTVHNSINSKCANVTGCDKIKPIHPMPKLLGFSAHFEKFIHLANLPRSFYCTLQNRGEPARIILMKFQTMTYRIFGFFLLSLFRNFYVRIVTFYSS